MKNYTRNDLKMLFGLLYELDINGFFEWDLCKGNILKSKNSFKLFDFGYMYKFDPLKELNNEGFTASGFYPIERFETRSYLHVLRDMKQEEAFVRYRELKEETVNYYEKKIAFLKEKDAMEQVILFYVNMVEELNFILDKDDLVEQAFIKNIYRATRLDIEDDISGKSCSKYTIEKIDYIMVLVEEYFDILSGMFEGKTKDAILEENEEHRRLAKLYFLENVDY
jgi:hypothetical protein